MSENSVEFYEVPEPDWGQMFSPGATGYLLVPPKGLLRRLWYRLRRRQIVYPVTVAASATDTVDEATFTVSFAEDE